MAIADLDSIKFLKHLKSKGITPSSSASKIQTTFEPNTYTSSFKPMPSDYQIPEENVETGGQSTRKLLTSSLQEARRRAGLTGRNLSKAETEGIVGGYYAGAAERLAAKKALSLQKRGQDITFEGLKSTERMKGADIELARQQLQSAEDMFKAGLISKEALEQKRMDVDVQIARMTGKTQEKAIESTGGLFGGGGKLGLGCIIITACTSPISYEVDIARQYRDCVLDAVTLGGYYALSHRVAPYIYKYKLIKTVVKRVLVDRMIDRFEWYFQLRERHRYRTSKFVTHRFLDLCRAIGRYADIKYYLNLHA